MTIRQLDHASSLSLYSDESLDEQGNLKGFVIPDEDEKEKSLDVEDFKESEEAFPRRSKRLGKRRKTDFRDAHLSRKDEEMLKYFESNKSAPSKIHKVMYSALDLLTPEKIIGRTTEAKQILSMILQPEGGIRPLLVGPAGVGKHSIVKLIAKMMMNEMKSHPFGNRKIICLDCNELLADSLTEDITAVVGEKLRTIVEEAYRTTTPPPVIYFRYIEKLVHLEKVNELLMSLLKRKHPFIASISDQVKSETVIKAEGILSRFNFAPFPVGEMPMDDVRQIVKTHFQKNKLHPQLVLTDEAVDLGIRLAVKYEHSRPFPIKAINLIQDCANNILFRNPLHVVHVDPFVIGPQEIAEIVSAKTKVPTDDLLDDSIFNQQRFINRLKSRVVGQDHAIEIVSDKVAAYKMQLVDGRKPWGVFLFVGPTGVGKTELATCIAKYLFNDESNLITINGSEYIEEYTVSNLIGSPRGYEGNESGGLLTEPLKKNPHLVVLLDEFEKAHENVQKLFLQIFDRGVVIDRKGELINCSQALFIMTSNIGSQMLSEEASKGNINLKDVGERLIPLLKEKFSPELVGRFKRGIVPFQPLTKAFMPKVAEVKLRAIKDRLERDAEIELSWTPELINHFVETDVDLGFGMREYCNMIDETVINIIKDAMIESNQRITGKLEFTYLKEKQEFALKLKKK